MANFLDIFEQTWNKSSITRSEKFSRIGTYTHSKLYLYIKSESCNELKANVLPQGFKIRFEGRNRAIAFDEAQWTQMSKILPAARAKVEASMRAYCENGPQNLPPQRFKFEIQYSNSGKMTRVEVFKARHVRFYGSCGNLGGRPVFLVTASDLSKKTDDADPAILQAAGKRAHELLHAANGKKKA